MDTLLTVIALWLAANFALPANADQPRIEMAPADKMIALRYRGFVNTQGQNEALSSAAGDVVSIYDDTKKTIYLPEGWEGRSPAELSILVHEMVHHLQNADNLRFECPQERERVAFEAQARWLALFGRDLESDFGLDAMSLFVKTRCIF